MPYTLPPPHAADWLGDWADVFGGAGAFDGFSRWHDRLDSVRWTFRGLVSDAAALLCKPQDAWSAELYPAADRMGYLGKRVKAATDK